MPRKTSENAVPAAETKKKAPSTAKKNTRSRETKTKTTESKKTRTKAKNTEKTTRKPRTNKEDVTEKADEIETIEAEIVQDSKPKRKGIGKNGNLIPISERTSEELREMTKKGGIASGKSRREKKNLREFGRDFLMQDTSPLFQELMMRNNVDQDEMTNAAALFVRMFTKAMSTGDLNAARQVVEWAGMAPLQEMRENEAIARMSQVIQLAQGTDDEGADLDEDVIFYIPENGRTIITDDVLDETGEEV